MLADDPQLYNHGDDTNLFEYQYPKQTELGHMGLGLPIGKASADPSSRMLSLSLCRISDAFNVASYELAASMLAVGLSWRQALPAIAVGHVIISWAITANGTIGSRLHVPFP